jgi:hypothetical protein
MAKTRSSSTSTRSRSKSTRARKSARPADKRDRVSTRTDTRYVKRTAKGRFKESDDAGRAQRRDKGTKAKKRVGSGFGDTGDRKRR